MIKEFMTWIFGRAIEDVMNEKIKAELEKMLEDKVTKPITTTVIKRIDETNAFIIMTAKHSSGLSGNKIQEAKEYAKILKDSDPEKSIFDRLIDVGIKKDNQQNS